MTIYLIRRFLPVGVILQRREQTLFAYPADEPFPMREIVATSGT